MGNSAWYIFAILCMWGITWVVYSLLGRYPDVALGAVILGVLAWEVWMSHAKGDATYTHNTAVCYAAGMLFSRFKGSVERVTTSPLGWSIVTAVSVALFFWLRPQAGEHFLVYGVYAVVFCFVVLLATMRVELRDPVLTWLGKNLFWIYILQRMPMALLAYLGWNASIPEWFTLVAFVGKVALVVVLGRLAAPVNRAISGK